MNFSLIFFFHSVSNSCDWSFLVTFSHLFLLLLQTQHYNTIVLMLCTILSWCLEDLVSWGFLWESMESTTTTLSVDYIWPNLLCLFPAKKSSSGRIGLQHKQIFNIYMPLLLPHLAVNSMELHLVSLGSLCASKITFCLIIPLNPPAKLPPYKHFYTT